jgi:hypothetical protein
MVNFRTVHNEPFVTKFPFILTNLGIWKSCRRITHISRLVDPHKCLTSKGLLVKEINL